LVNFISFVIAIGPEFNRMEYIIIPTSSQSEKVFDLLKKMQKKASTLSAEEMENYAFLKAMKEAEHSGKGNLNKVRSHLSKVANGKWKSP
jgi:hypothetical protein